VEKTAIIFGGSGYIGTNMITTFLSCHTFEKYIVCDIQQPPDHLRKDEVVFERVDVRHPIEFILKDVDPNTSWIFNFAAIHREPGHSDNEYFETNIPGANHIVSFADKNKIKNIFFTSSIAPYGQSTEKRTEDSLIYPDTPYGISKALAEGIHKEWMLKDNTRRLVIVRPGVIFGAKDPGNVYVMIRAIRRGTFILPNTGNIKKAHGYIEGLIESILFVMDKKDAFILYNYVENPLVSLKQMIAIIKEEYGYRKPVYRLPKTILIGIAYGVVMFSKIIRRKTKIHPIRVKKAGLSTNIFPEYLIRNKFKFKYDFRNALKHWKTNFPDLF